ncbi:MAG: hypothetical protein ACRDZ7_17630 [Acidimicrobiia bacterium]
MFELTKAEVLDLQALPVADSIVTEELAGLSRKGSRRHRASKSNVCLITLSNSLNDLSVLSDVLSIFGGGGGLGL